MNLIEAKAWADQMDVQVTVCDMQAIIVYMNEASCANFSKYGGAKLIGQSLLDCHAPASRQKIQAMLEVPQTATSMLDKGDHRKVIHQIPWMENGKHMGIIEIAFKIPLVLP